MRVAVTGTPGVGKTTATERLDVPVVHLNDAVREHDLTTGHDEERDSRVVDLDAAAEFVADRECDLLDGTDGDTLVVESHLAHRLAVDRVVVLRCRPDLLEERLQDRGESEASARENRESEALDVVLGEAVERHGADAVYEVDATDHDPSETAAVIRAVIDGDREPSAGTVDFVEYV
ncbi:adenylate kinase family protein [Halobaculum sp. MBLA0147]|uniref:adenylate kinase family protein n=1 Tax=Halobaculum sp. MBLA0147 TaxID=3079934 RepID=UPI0035266225